MRGFLRTHKTITAVITLAGFLVLYGLWPVSASIRGRLMAEIDIHRSHYEVLDYGLLAGWSPEYSRLLHERYGIKNRVVAGCTVSESQAAYIQSYNAIAITAANRKFGHDVFRECAEQAKKNWRQAHSDPQ